MNAVRHFFAANVIAASFAFCAISISGVGGLAVFLVDHSRETDASVLHTAVAIAELGRLHLTLVEAESAGRAFLVSSTLNSRSIYESTLQRVDEQLSSYKAFSSDNAEQHALIAPLEQNIARRFAYLEAAMGVRAAKGIDAMLLTPIGGGRREMQLIKEHIGQMKAIETRLMDERRSLQKHDDDRLQTVLLLLIAFAIGTTAVIFWHMKRLWLARVAAEAAALHLAHHDPLTGLPNRRLLDDRIRIGLARAKRARGLLAVLCLDLDGFKSVNDIHGHDAGDNLLRQVSERLNALMRSEDTVARIGGDEFVVVLSSIGDPAYSEHVAARIVRRLSAPYVIAEHQVRISATVGVALYPDSGMNAAELLKAGDAALYRAKLLGKARYATALATAA